MTAALSESPSRGWKPWAALNWLCHGVLAVGLMAPCMTIVPRMGSATDVARSIGLLPQAESYSVLSGILALFEDGDLVIALVLLTFSVLFPVAKLVVVRLTLQGAVCGAVPQKLLAAMAMFSKYSMTDVFVIALIVVASRTLPGDSQINLEWGAIAFALAALLSMYLTSAVKKAVL